MFVFYSINDSALARNNLALNRLGREASKLASSLDKISLCGLWRCERHATHAARTALDHSLLAIHTTRTVRGLYCYALLFVLSSFVVFARESRAPAGCVKREVHNQRERDVNWIAAWQQPSASVTAALCEKVREREGWRYVLIESENSEKIKREG